jgi:hypothetical protein
MSLLDLCERIEEKVTPGEFWFYSYYIPEPAAVEQTISRYDLGALTPVLKPHVRKPDPASRPIAL